MPFFLAGQGSGSAWLRELVTVGVMRTVDPEDAWRLRAEKGVRTVVVRTWEGLGDAIAMTPLIEWIARSAPELGLVVWPLDEVYAEIFDANPWVRYVWCEQDLEAAPDLFGVSRQSWYALTEPTLR